MPRQGGQAEREADEPCDRERESGALRDRTRDCDRPRGTTSPLVLLTDENAVSPTIGVILMVGIVVVIAVVVAVFALGLGSSPTEAPQVSFDFEYQDRTLTVVHDGGDVITERNTGDLVVIGHPPSGGTVRSSVPSSRYPIVSGDSLFGSVSPVPDGTEVDVVWESPGSGETVILAEHQV